MCNALSGHYFLDQLRIRQAPLRELDAQGRLHCFTRSTLRRFNVHRPSGSCATRLPKFCRRITTLVIVYGPPLPRSRFKRSVISEGNSGSVASPRMRRICSSSVGIGSRGPVHLLAFPAVTPVTAYAGTCRMATPCADEPTLQLFQHRIELIAHNAVGAANNLVSHWSVSFVPLPGSRVNPAIDPGRRASCRVRGFTNPSDPSLNSI